jgi:hypothetical protein
MKTHLSIGASRSKIFKVDIFTRKFRSSNILYRKSYVHILSYAQIYIENQEVAKDKNYEDFRNNVYKEFDKEFQSLPVYRREELIKATYQV